MSERPSTGSDSEAQPEPSRGSPLHRIASFLGIKGGLLGVAGTVIGLVVAVHQLTGGGAAAPATPSTGPSTPAPAQAPVTAPSFPPMNFSLPGRPAAAEASLNLSRSAGPPGTSLTVSGGGFAPGETVEILFHGLQRGKATADSTGAFGPTPITIPPDWQFKGQFDITAEGRTSIRHVSEPFQVQ